jgi:hypothetical protein
LDVLQFHGAGDRPQAQQLTADYTGAGPKTGLAICDYALAGPAYWVKEGNLSARIKELYLLWGAKPSKDLGGHQQLSEDVDPIEQLLRGLGI